ncbi:M48 family metallopeptidase [Flavobacterium algicola]|uniref:M48 family metallopeptidase n=1 Tax=Flavobacterium algicola TaxID=556529 RepID=UPI001EFDA0F5|nr:M48 family metallopeptidase [Flavobacterium algicola]MCG9791552.1 M48 family metallopeptidase [Flavobacterium algicola]
MKKSILQGIATIVLFFATWFALMQIDWISVFKVQKVKDKTEEKLGDLFWEVIQKNEVENKNPFIVKSIDSIVSALCVANDIDRDFIKVHVFTKDDVNAFAVPNGHLIIYSGLIQSADNPEELTGVIGHEMAHIQLNHVMKKLVKEVGLSALITMTTGNRGSEILKETTKKLSSSAFDRNFEKEADIQAVDYLIKANVNPAPFADFLYKLAQNESQASEYLTWISTHPDSKERSEYILKYSKGKAKKFKSIIAPRTWEKIIDELDKQ